MKIVGCQWNLAWESPLANYARAEELLTPVERADLIVLPEMFSSGFSMNVEKVAEFSPSQSELFLKKISAAKNSAVMGGLVRHQEDGKGTNELIAFDADGGELGRYQKNRTFRYSGESDFYENGTEVRVWTCQGIRVTGFICYDLRFPELFRRAVAKGAELIVVIASWPTVRLDHWITLLRARAIENLAYVVGVNRCGSDPNMEYPGRSIVVDPWGEIAADAGADEGLLECELDLMKLRKWREEFPALRDLEVL
ncbi:MAG: carbon-nitrogen family hydrolase [Verrucomicrobiales bacterium]|nr:carbon-nitrogen family hydrolase [Verrucomicrobiales bacterium]